MRSKRDDLPESIAASAIVESATILVFVLASVGIWWPLLFAVGLKCGSSFALDVWNARRKRRQIAMLAERIRTLPRVKPTGEVLSFCDRDALHVPGKRCDRCGVTP